MNVKTGTYTGNGSTRSITGVGFDTSLGGVIIKGLGTPRSGCIRTGSMAGDKTKDLFIFGATFTGGITSLDSDGFSLGTNGAVNANGATYYWVAWAADDVDSSIGTYTGNASDDRTIATGISDHDMILIYGENSSGAPVWRSTLMTGDQTMTFGNNANLTNSIQDQSAGDFEVGTGNDVNASGQTYHFAAFKDSTVFKVLTWTGNATDDRNITGVGFQPTCAFVGHFDASTSTDRAVFCRFGAQAGDNSQALDWTAETNRIQNFISDGIQVGSAANVNKSSVSIWAFFMTDGQTLSVQIAGNVSLSGSPVTGAEVYAMNQTTLEVFGPDTTDGSGDYSILVYPNALYHVFVQYEDDPLLYNAPSLWNVEPVP